ncbi:MAG TPA: hypothetical protein VKM93_14280 [Terriglobia bacterium]|nr:hypothetical protein [Terriglobia bacterium]
MANVLETELKAYEHHRDNLLSTAEGKFALVRGDAVVGVYESEIDAISEGYRRFGNVPFLVKQIVRIETPLNFVSDLLGV